MKRNLSLLVIAIGLALGGPAAAVVKGNALLEACEAPEGSESRGVCKGFIMGVIDLGDGSVFCIPAGKGVTYRQAGDIALKTLRDIPAIRNEDAATIISASLMAVFPCEAKKPRPTL